MEITREDFEVYKRLWERDFDMWNIPEVMEATRFDREKVMYIFTHFNELLHKFKRRRRVSYGGGTIQSRGRISNEKMSGMLQN